MLVDAQVGKTLIFGSLLQCPEQVLTIAAGLSGKSIFVRGEQGDRAKRRLSGRHMSDHLALLGPCRGGRSCEEGGGRGAREYCAELGLHQGG